MTVLFKTVHGSRLYNLHNESSDWDYYTVIDAAPSGNVRRSYAKQTIVGEDDSLVIDFSTWLHYCWIGVPQALEAMFSTQVIESQIEDFRQSYLAGSAVYERYLRTIKSFAYGDDPLYKKRRHSLRLALNLRDLARYGRFDPTLSNEDALFVSKLSQHSSKQVYGMARSLALS